MGENRMFARVVVDRRLLMVRVEKAQEVKTRLANYTPLDRIQSKIPHLSETASITILDND